MDSTSPRRPPHLDEALPHQLRRATQAWTVMWQQHIPDLTNPQFAVLLVLDDSGSLDQSALGALTAIDRSTLTPLLDRLEALGLVSKEIDPANRRRRIVTLTDAGRERLASASAEAHQLFLQVEELLGTERLKELVGMLRAVGDMPGRPRA